MKIPPGLMNNNTVTDACRFLAAWRWKIAGSGDGWTADDFNLGAILTYFWHHKHPVIAEQALIHGVFGTTPPTLEKQIRAVDEGEFTIDHSTGKEVRTKAFEDLGGW